MRKSFLLTATYLTIFAVGFQTVDEARRSNHREGNGSLFNVSIPTEKYFSSKMQFDSKLWKYAYVRTDCPPQNICMLDDFIQRYGIVGMTRFQLHDLLGPDGLTTDDKEVLNLGGGSCTTFVNWSLEIEYRLDFPFNFVHSLAPVERYRVVLHRCKLPQLHPKTPDGNLGFKCTREDYPWISQKGANRPFKSILRLENI